MYGTNTASSVNNYVSVEYVLIQQARQMPPATPPLPEALVLKVMEAISLLDLDLPCRPEDVKRARRRLARLHHPDVGGDVALMQQINVAADFLLDGVRPAGVG